MFFYYLATYSDTALLVLRLAFGSVVLAHGIPKLRDLKANATAFNQMGFKPGALFGTVAGILEVFGGIAIVLGFLTQPVAALFVIQFVVILVWRITKKHGFVGGWELDLLILSMALLLLSIGSGNYSVDASFLLSGF
jgi:putative oxidoreductase